MPRCVFPSVKPVANVVWKGSILTLAALLLCWLGELLFFPGLHTKAVLSARPGIATALTPSDSKFFFGTLPKGGRSQKTFWLHNTGESTVEIAYTENSCDCLEVLVTSKPLGPNEKVLATITVDFSHKPTFVGTLELKASGYAKAKYPMGKNTLAFEIVAEVSANDFSE